MYRLGNDVIIAKFLEGDILKNIENLMKNTNYSSGLIINGIGMLENTVIGYYTGKEYIVDEISDAVELVSLQGNIGMHESKYIIHAHAALATKNHLIKGGHLIRGNVKVVNELAIYPLDDIKIKRVKKGKLMEMNLE